MVKFRDEAMELIDMELIDRHEIKGMLLLHGNICNRERFWEGI
jgi:hypothetical protein